MDETHEALPAAPQPMRPEFSKELYARLQRQDGSMPARTVPWSKWITVAAGVALVAALVISPSARALADSFLSLFRVHKITAIAVDPARIEQLRQSGLTDASIESLIGESLIDGEQAVRERAKPRQVADLNEASRMAGFVARVPAALAAVPSRTFVQDAASIRLRADSGRINALLQLAGVGDMVVPAQLDGAIVTVDKPAAIVIEFDRGGREPMRVMQSRGPEVTLPEGIDLAQLGEIGLRVIGLPPEEARRVAQSTDWASTLMVPIPADAASFREVTLDNGATGLLITSGGTGATSMRSGSGERQRSLVLWTEGDMVYGVTGGFGDDVIEIANSMR
jgi:hypothetical protein